TKSKSAAGALGPYKETQVVDKYTAKVVFSQPNAAFMNEVAGFSIVSPSAVQKFSADFARNPVGTCQFKVKEYVVGEHGTVVRNPDDNCDTNSLSAGRASLIDDTVRIQVEHGTRFNAVKTVENLFAPNLYPKDFAKVKGDSHCTVYQ